MEKARRKNNSSGDSDSSTHRSRVDTNDKGVPAPHGPRSDTYDPDTTTPWPEDDGRYRNNDSGGSGRGDTW